MADFTGNLYSKVLGMNTAVRIITQNAETTMVLSGRYTCSMD